MSWMDDELGPVSTMDDGDELPERAVINFSTGLTAADDSRNERTNVTADYASGTQPGIAPQVGVSGSVLGTTDGSSPSWAKILTANVDLTAKLGLLGLLFRGAVVFNEETLAAAKSLDIDDPHFQNLDPGGANRNIALDAEASMTGMWFLIRNSDTAPGDDLVVRNDTPATLITLAEGEMAIVICNGTAWSTFGPF